MVHTVNSISLLANLHKIKKVQLLYNKVWQFLQQHGLVYKKGQLHSCIFLLYYLLNYFV